MFLLKGFVQTISFKFFKQSFGASTSAFHLARPHDFSRSFNFLSSLKNDKLTFSITFQPIFFQQETFNEQAPCCPEIVRSKTATDRPPIVSIKTYKKGCNFFL